MKVNTVLGPVVTFVEKSDVTLAADTLVTLHTDGTVKAATAGSAIGVFVERLTTGSKDVAIRLFKNGGTCRVIQAATIAIGDPVGQSTASPTKVRTAVAGDVYLGIKKGPSAGAADDVIEIIDGAISLLGDPTFVAQTNVLHGSVDGAVAAITLAAATATNGVAAAASADLAALAAETEKIGDDGRDTRTKFASLVTAVETLGDDVRSLRAKLISAGIPITEA